MKKLFLVLVVMIGVSGCATYVGQADRPYYHYSCVYHCDTIGGCRTTCGNHYYATNGIVYYYDADHQKWDGHARYRQEEAMPEHHNADDRDTHGKAR